MEDSINKFNIHAQLNNNKWGNLISILYFIKEFVFIKVFDTSKKSIENFTRYNKHTYVVKNDVINSYATNFINVQIFNQTNILKNINFPVLKIAKSTMHTKSDYYNLKVIINDEKIKVHQTLDIITSDTLLVNINPPKVYINKRRNEFIYFNKENRKIYDTY